MTVWIAGLIAISVTCVFVVLMRPRSDNDLSRRMQVLQGRASADPFNQTGDDFFDRVVKPLLDNVSRWMGHRVTRFSLTDIDKKLTMAGRPLNLSAEHFVALRVVAAVVGAIGLVLLSSSTDGVGTNSVVFAALGMFIGWLFPEMWLNSTIRERQKSIQNELPGVLDILVITTEAGLGFDAAIRRICSTTKGVLVDEFSKVLDDIQLNKPRSEALRAMAERCGVDDLNMFLKSLIQAEKLGASGIAKALQVHSESIREKLRQRIEEQGSKSAVTMILPTAMFILPALFGVVLGGAIVDLWRGF